MTPSVSERLKNALAAHQRGDLQAALEAYAAILEQEPDNPDATALTGVALCSAGQAEAGLVFLGRAVALDAGAPLFRLYLGNAQMDHGALAEAAQSFAAGEKLSPQVAAFSYNRGNALRLAGLWGEAGEAYLKALGKDPRHSQARNNLATVHAHFGRFSEACAQLERTLAEKPDYAEAWLNLCNFAEKAGSFQRAKEAGEQACAFPQTAKEARLGLGVALNRLGQDAQAREVYRAALALDPHWAEAWDNLGQTCEFLGLLEEAEAAYRQAIEADGQSLQDEAVLTCAEEKLGKRHWHLALLELLRGDLRLGFARYRARFAEMGARADFGVPVWRGQDLKGKTLLVLDEQGLGDAVMMARFLPLAKEQGARVLFAAPPALAPLLIGWEGADELVRRGEPLPPFDYVATIFDLPYGFGAGLDTLPSAGGYLPLPPVCGELSQEGPRKIGLVWAGAPLHKHDARRSIPLALFEPLLAAHKAGSRFYSLNRDKREGDEALLALWGIEDLAPRLSSLADTASLMAEMDLVISCDTSSAHLAGALGRPVWTLLPFAPDWRWLTGRQDSPWYASMRLFRQAAPNDWSGVIQAVSAALAQGEI